MEEVKQDQTVQSEEATIEKIAGEEQTVDTAATEESIETNTGILEQEDISTGLSLEDIVSPEVDPRKVKEGTSPALQRRMNKLVSERNEALKKLKEAEAKALAANKPVVPIRDNFEDDASYQEEFDKYLVDKPQYDKATEALTEISEEQVSVIEENNNRYIKQADELQEKFPQIDIRKKIDTTDFGGEASAAIARSEHSAKIALYYALNPKALTEFRKLGFADACTEVGRQESKITNMPKTETTKAAKPLETLKGGTETVTQPKDLYKIKDSDEWFKARNKAIRQKQTA